MLKHKRILLLAIAFMSSCQHENINERISGNRWTFWDVVYTEGKYCEKPTKGYFFHASGKYYAYVYSNGRIPADESSGTHTPPTIAANLRNWNIVDDSILRLHTMVYRILKVTDDSMFLVVKSKDRSLIKLAKVK